MTIPQEPSAARKLRLYSLYLEARDAVPLGGGFITYDWDPLPDRLGGLWLPYGQMLEDFARELANVINDLVNHVHRLETWAAIMPTLDPHDTMEAAHEFVNVLGAAAMGLPYVIKSRLAFAAGQLSHQANMARDIDGWTDDFPDQGALYLHHIHKTCAGWSRFKAFNKAVDALGGKAFKTGTGDFRNAYNHRFPRRLVQGVTSFVERRTDPRTGTPVYQIGGFAPLSLTAVAGLLARERDLAAVAFEAFQALVGEHIEAIVAFERARRVTAPDEAADVEP